jgi:ArsR family transcriptional regulator, arsenate/arsenite/antimonite-responsive transcriptional repressor / arsenate reductase (thioredoxin)
MGQAMPDFLRLAGHPIRWQLLGALAGSDLRVQELTDRVEAPQNLVSYHLGLLRSGQLVTARRSSADGRDVYYRVDLERCAGLLAGTGAALHPGLRLAPAAFDAGRRSRARVLFLCTGNSARSQMAEALIRHASGGRVHADSAGSAPKDLHPDAVAAMATYGIDISAQRCKHLDTLRHRRFTHVVTLCDKVREVCPDFPGAGEQSHWSVPDPAREPEGYPAFERVAADLRTRVNFLLHRILST